MSEPEPGPHLPNPIPIDPPSTEPDDTPSTGPNLYVLYSLIALALAAAIGAALMIVLPFYHRR
jgi:hypothetical protein